MNERQRDVAERHARLLEVMALEAKAAGLDALAYLEGMARMEAHERAKRI